MRAVGLIVEYNPFHNGHLYHLEQSVRLTEADAVVAVMSGHFLQRGEPALLDKWARTEAALRGGCDLVIELPAAYATQAADWFAYGAVSLLEATGVVDAFCFGTESGEIGLLREAARAIASEPAGFRQLLRERLQAGVNYPAAHSAALAQYLTESGYPEASQFPFAQPNHTLGLHYLIALERINGSMTPLTIRREKSGYNETTASDSHIASATAIRRMLLETGRPAEAKAYVPISTYQVLEREYEAGRAPVSWDNLFPQLLYAIGMRTAEQLADFREIAEGLENRIVQTLPKLETASFEQLIDALKTKRYTRTKLQRALLSVLLGHAKADMTADKLRSGVEYIRVLGFTDKGQTLLRQMRSTARLPVLLSAARPPGRYRYLELDTQATIAYRLGLPGPVKSGELYRDFKEKPVIVQHKSARHQ
ncbi:nucleotidyltransferase [Paenibacillus protaetiae]|uniref:tRNA(Met) cytidine acetate ligase n=1 Tax=Paenibacillus protaetiae TaxID=2509456 RepID=A0A4P6ERQ7_9BACL|nr:nucleotidyltransferase [Paenibacillus protaetiae]QAY65564.1 nucleotidyltransferase [Paenibacillus protaetiae]